LPAIVAEGIDFITIANRHGGVPHHAIGAVGRLAELVARGTRRRDAGSDQRGDFRTRHRTIEHVLIDEFAGDVEEAAIAQLETGVGADLAKAIRTSYSGVGEIKLEKEYYRKVMEYSKQIIQALEIQYIVKEENLSLTQL
jgi:hypothetical protein